MASIRDIIRQLTKEMALECISAEEHRTQKSEHLKTLYSSKQLILEVQSHLPPIPSCHTSNSPLSLPNRLKTTQRLPKPTHIKTIIPPIFRLPSLRKRHFRCSLTFLALE